MAQPVLYKIASFDASANTIISFAYDGEQVFGNELVIVENATNKQVYDVKKDNWMRLTHEISASGSGLKNGTYYAAKIRVFNKAGVASEWSEQRAFYCLTNGELVFTNIVNGRIIQDKQYTFTLKYSQAENEPLESYTVSLYDANKVLINTSSALNGNDEELSYTVTSLEDGKQYYITADGTTVNGMTVHTDYVLFSVKYIQPSYWAYVDLSNNQNDGTIRVGCNIRLITAKYNGGDAPTFINGQKIDITKDGTSVEFDSGYIQTGDFTVKMLAQQIPVRKPFFEMTDGAGTVIRLMLKENWFSAGSYMANGRPADDTLLGCRVLYMECNCTSPKGVMQYEIRTRALDALRDGEIYLIELKRIQDAYGLKVLVKNEADYQTIAEEVQE